MAQLPDNFKPEAQSHRVFGVMKSMFPGQEIKYYEDIQADSIRFIAETRNDKKEIQEQTSFALTRDELGVLENASPADIRTVIEQKTNSA